MMIAQLQLLDSHGIQCRIRYGRLQALDVSMNFSSDLTPANITTEWVDVTDWDSAKLKRWLGY